MFRKPLSTAHTFPQTSRVDPTSFSQIHCSEISIISDLKNQGVVPSSDHHMFETIERQAYQQTPKDLSLHLPRSHSKTFPIKYPKLPTPPPNLNNPQNFPAPDQSK